MKQKALSDWLKVMIVIAFICIILIYGVMIPALGQYTLDKYNDPALQKYYDVWIGFTHGTFPPVAIAMVIAFIVAVNIGKDRSFCHENAKHLKWIGILAMVDGIYFFLGNIILLFLDLNHPGVILMCLVFVFLCAAVSIAAMLLSHLIKKAADLKDESDLTI